MTKNNSSQISIFMDNHIRFKILNEPYSIDYKNEELTFSELESIIESNLEYWNAKNEESDKCTVIRDIWYMWSERVNSLKSYLEQEDELIAEKLYGFMYSIFSSSPESLPNELKLYSLYIDSPIDKDNEIAMIRIFIDYYLNSGAKDDLSTAIKNYICIEKNKSYIGRYLYDTNASNFLPAFFVLNKEIRKEEMPFSNFQEEVIKPVSKKIEEIDLKIKDKFIETTKLIEEKDEDIIGIFNKHRSEINEIKIEINEWKNNKENQINTLEETYKNKLQLEAPEKLWETRARKYRTNTIWWMVGLIISIAILLASSSILVLNIHDYLQGTVKDIPFISKSFIYVAFISFLIYIIRIIIKIIVSNQHMSMEYEQKAALTRFYQALVQDGKEVDKEEKIIIFNALFKKTDTGLIKTDNSNDAEALLNILSKKE